MVGAFGGSLTYIENTGTPKAPAFMLRSGSLNPFNGNVVDASTAAFADLDGDGTLRPRPSIDKLRSHVLCLSQATWTS